MVRTSGPQTKIDGDSGKAPPSPREASGAAPAGLVAERFDVDGVEFVAFSWESAPDVSALTPAELEVFELLLRGVSNAAIARARQASVRTVANQVASIFRKLGVGSRYELMARSPGLASP